MWGQPGEGQVLGTTAENIEASGEAAMRYADMGYLIYTYVCIPEPLPLEMATT
jgi:hypothetical protein